MDIHHVLEILPGFLLIIGLVLVACGIGIGAEKLENFLQIRSKNKTA